VELGAAEGGEEALQVAKIAAVLAVAFLMVWTPVATAGHGGGELLRQPAQGQAR